MVVNFYTMKHQIVIWFSDAGIYLNPFANTHE